MRPLGAKAPLAVTLDVDSSVFTYTLLLEVVAYVSRVLQEQIWRVVMQAWCRQN
jgi:hypothetical protein